MRPNGPTFWLLDGITGWRSIHQDHVSAGHESGIRLASDPNGPLALSSPDGSLGGLLLPLGMAIDEQGIVYLLVDQSVTSGFSDPQILRYNPEEKNFKPLPFIGSYGQDARQFDRPNQIAVANQDLYIVDQGNHRIQVFDLRSLALRFIWGAPAPVDWRPIDLAAADAAVYILDQAQSRVFRNPIGTDRLELIIDRSDAHQAQTWTRIAVDRAGWIYLLDSPAGEPPILEIFTANGDYIGETDQAGEVRDRFAPPALRLDAKGRFCLPSSLMKPCARTVSATPPNLDRPLDGCQPAGQIYDQEGRLARVEPDELVGPPSYVKQGVWIAGPLDSRIYRCQWHRVELELGALPAGASMTASTFCAADELGKEDLLNLPAEAWQQCFTAIGQMQPPAFAGQQPGAGSAEFLVQSHEGQYLWLKLELHGDGFSSPAITSARVHYPRLSYLNDLPAVYGGDEQSRWFLERYLSIFQSEVVGLETAIEDMPKLFDPKAVPDGEFLANLANWLALPLEGTWSEAQKRVLLEAAPFFYQRRGAPSSLRRYLQIYLQSMTGVKPEEQGAYPFLLEGFRERQHALLAVDNLSQLNYGAPLWSPAIVSRLQLDVYSLEGEVRLVSTGDPQRDIFHEFAHRFRVFVPSIWIQTGDDERMFRRALDAEKPAHTNYDLCLVEPRLRVGVQSTVGIDTIIGNYPQAQLACKNETNAPPSRPPRHRLGYDTILAGRPAGGPAIHLAPGTRVGKNTLIN